METNHSRVPLSPVTVESEGDSFDVETFSSVSGRRSPTQIEQQTIRVDQITAPSPRDPVEKNAPAIYQKLPQVKETYLAYVVAVRDPLNFHLDIYWPVEIAERYATAIRYDYTFVSEELSPSVYVRPAYSCHLRGVEIIQSADNDFSNMKEAYILMSKRILRSGGWVLVSVSDIDVYRRILVNVFNVVTRKSLNQELLNRRSSRTGEPIAKEYSRPIRMKAMFNPQTTSPRDYHIIYERRKESPSASPGKASPSLSPGRVSYQSPSLSPGRDSHL